MISALDQAILKVKIADDCKSDKILDDVANGNQLTEEVQFLYDDSMEGILGDIKRTCDQKKFYKSVSDKETLDFKDLPALSSLETHIYLKLNFRKEVRDRVELGTFKHLLDKVQTLKKQVFITGSQQNTLTKYFKQLT